MAAGRKTRAIANLGTTCIRRRATGGRMCTRTARIRSAEAEPDRHAVALISPLSNQPDALICRHLWHGKNSTLGNLHVIRHGIRLDEERSR
jgi:hypothetical protein